MEFEFDVSHQFSKYLSKQMLHEAGYDSYLTGIVFASIAKYLEANHYLSNLRYKEELNQRVLQ